MEPRTTNLVIIIVLIAIIIGLVFWKMASGSPLGMATPTPTTSAMASASPTFSPTPSVSPSSSSSPSGNTTSDGVISFSRSDDYALAATAQQMTVQGSVPPCDEGFNYCLYYTGDDYQNTNFENAGVRIQKRTDLVSESACLTTAPSGFTNLTPGPTKSENTYASSQFPNVNNAAAGHASFGKLSRVYVRSNAACYEFETRVGYAQFANFPAGTIQEFTSSDRDDVIKKLDDIVDDISLTGGESGLVP